jgi:hypothetical protein
VAFSIFLAGDSKKICLQIFEQEIRKFFQNFDQKSQNMSYDFQRAYKKYVVTYAKSKSGLLKIISR